MVLWFSWNDILIWQKNPISSRVATLALTNLASSLKLEKYFPGSLEKKNLINSYGMFSIY